jgi:UDPglucose--hexose-1-phosphate uridylyltransferase
VSEPESPKFRVDPLTGERVAIVASRQARPNLASDAGVSALDGCPFCVGGLEAPEPYTVRAFENRWPPFREEEGAAEIVLYSPDHDGSLATIGVEGVRAVVDLWAERTDALLARPEVEYVLVFENRGSLVGATIPHPHGQIYAFPFVPPVPAREAEVAAEHGCPLCRAVPDEVEAGTRVVRDDGGWVTYVPYASGFPYGMLLAPHDHVESLSDLDPTSRDGLAAALVDLVARYDSLFAAEMPYLMWVHPGVHVHLHFAPPLRAAGVQRYIASGELGSGLLANPVAPEAAAEALRSA